MIRKIIKIGKTQTVGLRLLALSCVCAGVLIGCGPLRSDAYYAQENAKSQLPAVENKLSETINSLRAAGGHFVQVGESTLVAFPASELFNGHSPNVSEAGKVNLKLLQTLLNQYEVIDVEVQGVTYSKKAKEADLGLAQAQANHVSAALWKMGVNVRMMVAADGLHKKGGRALFHDASLHDNLVQVRFRYLRN